MNKIINDYFSSEEEYLITNTKFDNTERFEKQLSEDRKPMPPSNKSGQKKSAPSNSELIEKDISG